MKAEHATGHRRGRDHTMSGLGTRPTISRSSARLSERLVLDLTAHRTAALRDAMKAKKLSIQAVKLFRWRGENPNILSGRAQVDDVRTFQFPDGAEGWLREILAHVESGKRDETLEEMRDPMSVVDPAVGA